MPHANKPAPPHAATKSAQGSSLRRWLPLVVLAALAAIVLHLELHLYLNLERLADNEVALRTLVAEYPIATVAGYAAIYVASVALSLPGGLVLTLAGGFLFGWLTAGLVTVIAATFGASVLFLIARSTVGAFLAARAGPRLSAFADGFRRDALCYLLFLRLVPAFPFWLVNLAPALLGVRLPTFALATFLGIIPGTFAFAVIGSGLGSVFAGQRRAYESCLAHASASGQCSFSIEPSALLTPGLLAAFGALGVLALLPVVGRRLMASRGLAP